MSKRLTARAPRSNVRPMSAWQQIEAERAAYHAILTAWADDTHRRMYRDPRRLYAYHVPSTATAYGQLFAVAEGDDPPEGANLIDPEPVSGWTTRPQLWAWIEQRANRLPMYPPRPR